jgi:bacterioferritin-associated ferredoxin
MIVCVCNEVTESEIRSCVALGCQDLDAVREALGVAGCCGSCADCARNVIETCRLRDAEATS